MGTRRFMDTIAIIYRDVLTYVNYKKLGKTPLDTDVIQSDEDLELAKELVSFVKSGSYLPERRYTEGCKKLLKVYTEGKQPSTFVDVLEVDVRTVKKYGSYIIEGLDVFFDGSLMEMWVSRSFETIKNSLDSRYSQEVRNNFLQVIDSYEDLIDLKTDLMRVSEIDVLVSSWTQNDFEEALLSVSHVFKFLRMYDTLKRQGDFDLFNAVKRNVKQGKKLPKGIVSDINSLLDTYFKKGVKVDEFEEESIYE